MEEGARPPGRCLASIGVLLPACSCPLVYALEVLINQLWPVVVVRARQY
jgi:hypothetical protein